MLTKSFDYELPAQITGQSYQIAFDVIDILAHNSIEKNKKINIDTCIVRSETVIFNFIQGALNLLKSDEALAIINSVQQEKRTLVFKACLIHGILQSRQSLACNGLQKFYPWNVQCLIAVLACIAQANDSNELKNLPSTLLKVKLSNNLR